MKADDQTFFDLLRILKNRTRPALIAAFAVLLAMTCFVFLLPAVYESRATLLIEEMDIPVELTGDLGTQQYVEQRLQRTRQRVLTDENVKNLIKRLEVYDMSGDESDSQTAVDVFHEHVFITPQVTGVIDPRTMRAAELTYAFDVGFWHSIPETATNVANELADLFVESSAAQAKEDALRTIEFAKTESERLAGELRVREARLTEFREKNPGGLPEDRVRNQDRALALERELATIDAELREARGRRDLLSAQLAATPRDNPVIDENGQVVVGGADRLTQAQQELVAALAKYSENHPDVRRLRREIATLKVEVGGQPTSPPTNPAYAQLETQVGAANIESRELGARRHTVSQQLAALEGEITLSPRLEERYRELVRDYEVMKTQYEQMRARQATAELQAKAASGAAVAESYVLVNPARVPDSPIEPDRLALMFLSVVLAIAAGLGTAYFLHMADSTIRGSSDVVALTGQQVFAHVPTMRSATEERRRRVNDFALATAIAVVAILVLYFVN
jgi:polysaccharide biosynthesis transport protein